MTAHAHTLLVGVLLTTAVVAPSARQATNPDAALLAQFRERTKAYSDLHRKLEAELPELKSDAGLEARFQHEMALASKLRRARAGVRQGDLWPPKMRALVRRLLARVVLGPEGARIRQALSDEAPPPVPVVVNAPYPESAPFSTMPPQLLAELPPLPDELEYRFIAKTLILRDVHANLIADYIEKAIP